MIKQQADLSVAEINKIKEENWEELYLIIKYSFEALLNYMFFSRSKMNIPKTSLNIIASYIKTFKEERKILNFIINHISYIDKENLELFLEKLNTLNEQTINYFYDLLDNIEDAIDLNDESRMITPKNFKFLPKNRKIKTDACNLVLSKEFIKGYLGFENDFWTFIDERTVFTDEVKISKIDYKYGIGEQIKLSLFLPPITDLETALTAVRGYNKAHIIYLSNKKTRLENPEEGIKKYYLNMQKHFNIE